MKAFSEKSDMILRTLLNNQILNWDKFKTLTGVQSDDPLLIVLKETKGLIEYTDKEIQLTDTGKEFISTTSFVEQRDKQTQS